MGSTLKWEWSRTVEDIICSGDRKGKLTAPANQNIIKDKDHYL